MRWIISHQSALEFWRSTNAKDTLHGKKLRLLKLPVLPLCTKELHFRNMNLKTPLHVMVGNANGRKATRKLHCHVSSGDYQNGSFIIINSGLAVSSPELCFLQMAGEISLIDLVKLGYEFCGTYRLNLNEKNSENEHIPGAYVSNKGFRKDIPLTSVAKLNSYVEKTVFLKGRSNALRSFSFIADGSASPMETILTMSLTLPYRFGGYGFVKPMLNFPIVVSDKVRNSENNTTFFCDLYWPKKKVAVEYDSNEYHTRPDRICNDAIRRNALTSTGVTVVTVSYRQVAEISRLRELSEVLAKLLGKRLKCHSVEFTFRHARLMDQILPGRFMVRQDV